MAIEDVNRLMHEAGDDMINAGQHVFEGNEFFTGMGQAALDGQHIIQHYREILEPAKILVDALVGAMQNELRLDADKVASRYNDANEKIESSLSLARQSTEKANQAAGQGSSSARAIADRLGAVSEDMVRDSVAIKTENLRKAEEIQGIQESVEGEAVALQQAFETAEKALGSLASKYGNIQQGGESAASALSLYPDLMRVLGQEAQAYNA
ncbi:MAG TPA: hypothetical protein VJR27_01725 [Candidatus Saccharimonadales bacterium]|nr:hypothetical protein [Candidatus Saccharimonadales bacterium]